MYNMTIQVHRHEREGVLTATGVSKIRVELPHQHYVEIIDTDEDVAIVMYYPDQDDMVPYAGVALESVMKETST